MKVARRSWYRLLSEDEVLIIEQANLREALVRRLFGVLARSAESHEWLERRLKPMDYKSGIELLKRLAERKRKQCSTGKL